MNLPVGTQLRRIFDPTRHNTKALDFRYFGPINRFDHQCAKGVNIKGEDPKRGIYYAGFTLSCCIVEVFGDEGVISLKDQQVCLVEIIRQLTLLDLRGEGAMRAGSVAALAKIGERALSQEWSRYFYEHFDDYSSVDGIIFYNAHNDEKAIALYERAEKSLVCSETNILRLDHPSLRPALQQIALNNNLDFDF
jgi:hypothetical protein